jgi:hypothetical protein
MSLELDPGMLSDVIALVNRHGFDIHFDADHGLITVAGPAEYVPEARFDWRTLAEVWAFLRGWQARDAQSR